MLTQLFYGESPALVVEFVEVTNAAVTVRAGGVIEKATCPTPPSLLRTIAITPFTRFSAL